MRQAHFCVGRRGRMRIDVGVAESGRPDFINFWRAGVESARANWMIEPAQLPALMRTLQRVAKYLENLGVTASATPGGR